MTYTLPAHSLLEIETTPEGILITETRHIGDTPQSVFISDDRLEEVLEILQIVQNDYNAREAC